jgi:hypothetical protein
MDSQTSSILGTSMRNLGLCKSMILGQPSEDDGIVLSQG